MIGNEVSKEDAAAYLRNHGLKAEVSNGVVVTYMPLADALKPKAMEKLRKMLAGIGYTASCGIKSEVEDE
jgi:hypothetical protein